MALLPGDATDIAAMVGKAFTAFDTLAGDKKKPSGRGIGGAVLRPRPQPHVCPHGARPRDPVSEGDTMELWVVFLLVGAVLAVVEIAILQMAVGWVLALGIGCLIAGGVGYVFVGLPLGGLLLVLAVCFVAVFFVLRLFLVRPDTSPPVFGSPQAFDLTAIGQTVEVIETISPDNPGKVRWSGALWTALCAAESTGDTPERIEAGTKGHIVGVEGNRLVIKAGPPSPSATLAPPGVSQ